MIAVFLLAIAAPPFVDVTTSAAVCAVQKQRAVFAEFIANEHHAFTHGGVQNNMLVWKAQQLIKKADSGLRDLKKNARAAGGKLIPCDDPRIDDVEECITENPDALIERCAPAREFFTSFTDWFSSPPSLWGNE
jgi:hypothetical protein